MGNDLGANEGWVAPSDYEITYYDFHRVREFRLWMSSPGTYDLRLSLETPYLRTNYRMILVFRDVRLVTFRDNNRYEAPWELWIDTEDVFLMPVEQEQVPEGFSERLWQDVSTGMRYVYGGKYDDPSTQLYWLCRDVEWESIEPVGRFEA